MTHKHRRPHVKRLSLDTLSQPDFVRIVNLLMQAPGRIGVAVRMASEGISWRLSCAEQAAEWGRAPYLQRLTVLIDAAVGMPVRMGDANPWSQRRGVRGGHIWVNSKTGAERYQVEQPGAHETGGDEPPDEHDRRAIHPSKLKVPDKLPGGRADNIPDSAFDADALARGTKQELEHTNDPAIAKEIAKDGLAEDPEMYDHDRRAVHPGKLRTVGHVTETSDALWKGSVHDTLRSFFGEPNRSERSAASYYVYYRANSLLRNGVRRIRVADHAAVYDRSGSDIELLIGNFGKGDPEHGRFVLQPGDDPQRVTKQLIEYAKHDAERHTKDDELANLDLPQERHPVFWHPWKLKTREKKP